MIPDTEILLIHDYLIDFGGAERVLLELHKMYPKALIYVLIYRPHKLGEHAKDFANAQIKQSWFGYIPFADKLISPLRFLLPLFWKSFNTKKFDLIISSASWAITKGFDKKSGAKEICYCHTPPRSLYGYDTARRWDTKWYRIFVDMYAAVVSHFLRMYDFKRSQKVDQFVANSENVRRRIKKFYRKPAVVIYPPVDVGGIIKKTKILRSALNDKTDDFYLTGGRMVASKNFDIILKACKKAKVKLKIYGSGPQLESLKKLADKNIEFLGRVSDEDLLMLYAQAKAFIIAQKDEDFGITPVEAMAAGTPVIAYKGGGYVESVVEDKTGVFFDKLDPISIQKAIKKSQKIEIKKSEIQKQASKFSTEEFKKRFESVVKSS